MTKNPLWKQETSKSTSVKLLCSKTPRKVEGESRNHRNHRALRHHDVSRANADFSGPADVDRRCHARGRYSSVSSLVLSERMAIAAGHQPTIKRLSRVVWTASDSIVPLVSTDDRRGHDHSSFGITKVCLRLVVILAIGRGVTPTARSQGKKVEKKGKITNLCSVASNRPVFCL